MVLPASVAAPFEVVKTKLSFHIFVAALDAPPLLEASHEGLATQTLGKSRQHVVFGRGACVAAFDDEPLLGIVDALFPHDAYSESRKL